MAVTTIYLVRHAKAGDRSRWDGDDTVRPLTESGRRQAESLADRFAPLHPPRLLSSPYVRCMQTLEPTGARTGTQVEATPLLSEGAAFEAVIELITELPADSVLCSHGDVIPATVTALHGRGAELRSAPDWRKGAVWALERADDGTITGLAAHAPPG